MSRKHGPACKYKGHKFIQLVASQSKLTCIYCGASPHEPRVRRKRKGNAVPVLLFGEQTPPLGYSRRAQKAYQAMQRAEILVSFP